jgi:hypothetical protein
MRLGNRVTAFLRKPHNVILVTLAVSLFFLTLLPLASLVRDTFVVHPSEIMAVRGAQAGDLTLFHWTKVFFSGATSREHAVPPALEHPGDRSGELFHGDLDGRHPGLAGDPQRPAMEGLHFSGLYFSVHPALLDLGHGLAQLSSGTRWSAGHQVCLQP